MIVYLLKFKSVKGAEKLEKFYKLGITKRTIEERVRELNSDEYDIVVQETLELPEDDARRAEKTFLSDWWKYKYYPTHKPKSSKEYLQNKMFLKSDDILIRQWEVINNPEDKLQYYIDKEARATEHKARYWRNKGRKNKNWK